MKTGDFHYCLRVIAGPSTQSHCVELIQFCFPDSEKELVWRVRFSGVPELLVSSEEAIVMRAIRIIGQVRIPSIHAGIRVRVSHYQGPTPKAVN